MALYGAVWQNSSINLREGQKSAKVVGETRPKTDCQGYTFSIQDSWKYPGAGKKEKLRKCLAYKGHGERGRTKTRRLTKFITCDKNVYMDDKKSHFCVDVSKMKEKHKLFAEHYSINQNATQSAIGAGYSSKSAGTQGSRLLKKDGVRAYIEQLLSPVKEKFKLSHEFVLERLRALAEQNEKNNPGVAVKAYELLGKHLGTFETKIADLEQRPAFIGININFGNKPNVEVIRANGEIIQSTTKKLPSPVTPAIDIKSKAIETNS